MPSIIMTAVPSYFKGRGIRDLTGICNSGLYFNPMNQGQVIALPAQFCPALGAPILVEQPASPASKSFVRKQFPRNVQTVPVLVNTPVTVLSFRTPQNSRVTLDAFQFCLYPSTLNEDNYVWSIYAAGVDLLNNPAGPTTGRPSRDNSLVPMNFEMDEKPVLDGGTLVEVVVRALNDLPASDQISAMLSMTVWAGVR